MEGTIGYKAVRRGGRTYWQCAASGIRRGLFRLVEVRRDMVCEERDERSDQNPNEASEGFGRNDSVPSQHAGSEDGEADHAERPLDDLRDEPGSALALGSPCLLSLADEAIDDPFDSFGQVPDRLLILGQGGDELRPVRLLGGLRILDWLIIRHAYRQGRRKR